MAASTDVTGTAFCGFRPATVEAPVGHVLDVIEILPFQPTA